MNGQRGAEFSAEASLDAGIETPARPVLVAERPVYDLAATRLKHAENETATPAVGLCKDGVCVLSWKPRRPQGDAA